MIDTSLRAIEDTAARLADALVVTPVRSWSGPAKDTLLGTDTSVALKLELFQHTGTFKVRGALNVLRQLDEDQRRRGITAISAGNHALAAAWVARKAGVPAKVVMVKTANPFRVARCRALGAELELAENAEQGFARVQELVEQEGLTFIHPFEGPHTSLGTATLGLEFCRQVPDLEAVIVPIGGGGLASGVSAAVKRTIPHCAVFGVEPEGAPTMTRSFQAGEPARLDSMDTVADSLAAPFTGPTSYALCREFLDDIVLVTDAQLHAAQALASEEFKLALEPAGAASTAALLGPLRQRLRGRRVGLIVCGSNIDATTFARQLAAAPTGDAPW